MMKRFLLFLFGFLLAASSQASYLYWQVSSTESQAAGVTDTLYARVCHFDKTDSSASVLQTVKAPMETAYRIDLGSISSGWFVIEVINYSTIQSIPQYDSDKAVTYEQLAMNNAIITGTGLTTEYAVWHGGSSYTPVPEPTSSLFILIGAALLGLKRQKV